jgi:hypothetical protein
MLINPRGELMQRLCSGAFSLCMFATGVPQCFAGSLPFNVATVVVMEDITAEMLIASAESGTGATITTTNGATSLSATGATGDQFATSFTAGSVQVNDMGTFTSSGGSQPEAGTWTIGTTAGSTVSSTGTATVTYDPGTSTYTTTLGERFEKTVVPGVGTVNDFHVVAVVPVTNPKWDPTDTGYSTLDGNMVGKMLYTTGSLYASAPYTPGQWTQSISGSGYGSIAGDVGAGSGTFSGSASAVPEPSSIGLFSIGVAVILYGLISSKRT